MKPDVLLTLDLYAWPGNEGGGSVLQVSEDGKGLQAEGHCCGEGGRGKPYPQHTPYPRKALLYVWWIPVTSRFLSQLHPLHHCAIKSAE